MTERSRLADLPVGLVLSSMAYPVQDCPCCGAMAAWVGHDLHCVACGCRFASPAQRVDRLQKLNRTPEDDGGSA